jgi:hypothetical protein
MTTQLSSIFLCLASIILHSKGKEKKTGKEKSIIIILYSILPLPIRMSQYCP